MGRFEKTIVIENGIDRRELGYYSTPTFISTFMTDKMLGINPNGKTALDPCVGKEEMIKSLYNSNIEVDGIDIHNHGDYFHCNFIEDDFIDFYKRNKIDLFFGQKIDLKYDYYIANPPYNCHEVDYIKNNKRSLNNVFGGIGAHNMYSMFISAIIDSAKEGALISIITADSFLTARMHNPLRNQILEECSIHYLILCPTDLFWEQKADVRTCIMILQKGKKHQGLVKTLNRPKDKADLKSKLEEEIFIETQLGNIVSKSGENQFEFVIDIPAEIQDFFNAPRVGEKFKCITGISTGADSKYISKEKKEGFEIPFYKNPGTRKFYCEPDGYLTNDYLKLDREIKNFMVRNKSYMLQEGITCSSMGLPFSACYLPEGSTYGVNANIFCNKNDIWWLLAYLNSSLVTYIVRGVLIRSNMITSGYVSKIPVLELSEKIKDQLSTIAKNVYKEKILAKEVGRFIKEIDMILFKELKLSKETEADIIHFASNLQTRV
jgi:type I restriction-modification system DNA methylase subunit